MRHWKWKERHATRNCQNIFRKTITATVDGRFQSCTSQGWIIDSIIYSIILHGFHLCTHQRSIVPGAAPKAAATRWSQKCLARVKLPWMDPMLNWETVLWRKQLGLSTYEKISYIYDIIWFSKYIYKYLYICIASEQISSVPLLSFLAESPPPCQWWSTLKNIKTPATCRLSLWHSKKILESQTISNYPDFRVRQNICFNSYSLNIARLTRLWCFPLKRSNLWDSDPNDSPFAHLAM